MSFAEIATTLPSSIWKCKCDTEKATNSEIQVKRTHICVLSTNSMDALQAIATSIGVIGVILLMVLLVLHFFTNTRTAAWIHSNREEKIGFSKNKIYHANGYLVSADAKPLISQWIWNANKSHCINSQQDKYPF